MYLYIIIGLLTVIVVLSLRKNQSKEHLENCYLNVNTANKNGEKTFFTNFMLDDYLNKNGRIDSLKENNIETTKILTKYKQNVYDSNSQYNNLNAEYNVFNNNMEGEFNKLNVALQNKIDETKKLKQSAITKFNKIDNNMVKVLGNPEGSLDTKLKPFVDTSIKKNLDQLRNLSINNIDSDMLFNNRMSQLPSDINNWKIVPGYGCPMRVDPNSGDIQCLSYDGKNCELNFVQQNGSDLTKIKNDNVKPVTCRNDGYSNSSSWCKGVYDYFAKNFITQVDWTNCPVGWTNNDKNGTVCQAPNDYKGPCSKTSGFSNYSNENKQSWAASCSARWPFKININNTIDNLGKISNTIDKDIVNKIGRIVPRTELDNVNTYNNGVYVQAYKLGLNNTRGEKLQDGIITTNINFDWGVGLIFGIRENNNQTNTNTIYLETTGFLKTPGNATSIKFKLTSDDGSRFIFSNTVEISNMSIVIDMWNSQSLNSKESSSIRVTPNQYLPFQLQFYENFGSATLKLEWSINGSTFSVIPRESFFINKEICNYQFNFNFVKEIDTRAQAIIPKTVTLFTISNPRIPLLSVPNFPLLGLMPDWEMNINFNVSGRQNSWRALIGDMYNNVNMRGWGVWVSPSNNIHFSWQSITWNANPVFNILPNTNYNLKITKNPVSLTLLLTNLNTYISQTSTNNSISQYVMTTNGPVTIGGWINFKGENFPGTISNITVTNNKR
jgi:CPW-WPC domain-containing protein